MLAALCPGAVVSGGAIGHAVADSDDALTGMGIVVIPLIVGNVVLPPANLRARGNPLQCISLRF